MPKIESKYFKSFKLKNVEITIKINKCKFVNSYKYYMKWYS